MEKCMFIGYPNRYKGWKVSIPSTQHTIISERAEFDENLFQMRNKQNLEVNASPNIDTEQIDTEPLKKGA